MSEWQPIETAPKDGTHVLLAWPELSSYAVVGFYSSGWEDMNCEADEDTPPPTHWMFLPAIPERRRP